MNYSRNIRRTQVAKRIIASWLIVAVVFFVLGFSIGRAASYKATDEQKADKGTVEALNEKVVIWGKYEGQKLNKEIDWELPDDFEPLDVDMDVELQKFVYCICQAYNLDFTFVMAVIENESRYISNLKSNTNDWGLMQINKNNHEWLSEVTGVTDYLNPYQNIIAGCYVLHELFLKYDDVNQVLMAYNMGEGNASKLWEKGVYESEYSRNVTEIQERLNEGGE